MKSTTLIVLGGLLFAGTSLAAEPQQIQHDDTTQAASSGSKVGIDPKTGKLRRLNAIESAQLDAIAARNQKAMPAKAKGKTVAQQAPQSFIAANGMLVVAEPLMVDNVATITADGQVVITHGEPQQTVEAANE